MSAHSLFISDLHLDAARPQATAAFIRFLAEQAIPADALYILGDLFDAWLGDDDDSPLADTVAQALRALSQHGTAIYFMRGNRDFLLGTDYARRYGMRLLPDPRSEEHTSELQSLMRISYAVFCLKKKKTKRH